MTITTNVPAADMPTHTLIEGLLKQLVDNLIERNAALESAATTTVGNDEDIAHLKRTAAEEAAAKRRAVYELGQLQEAHRTLETAHAFASEKLTALHKDVTDQSRIVTDLKKKLEDKTDEHTDAVRQIHDLRADLEKANDQLRQLAPANPLNIELQNSQMKTARLEAELKLAREKTAQLEDELTDARVSLKKATRAGQKKAPTTPAATVNLASIKRHLTTALKQFEEDPDKSFMALERALGLCSPDRKEASDDRATA
ncbi:hypothetical protein [Corynebacterium lipophiloflavum]|uniref:Uncharacterized protein n=1 Tax=Corynebacterium lipophiloflavum (strain ATCC 700352 / DSM 44291 / CCUG 37336 / JCM 10383 / DMMZ 1944) TaxID=525263 RepID=C0XTZ3_CORLD|nr:hypothetical protein [Corynebacterium lipophiloflavum]EEI16327.1 hypothetical protein HMPREF0298_1913 [Corynebacterium lipophiloflavum DSM 44291]